jgi:hypothetical protein
MGMPLYVSAPFVFAAGAASSVRVITADVSDAGLPTGFMYPYPVTNLS